MSGPIERLEAFGLPPSFPPDMVPTEAAQFVAESRKGMTKEELMAAATAKGFNPLWKPLPRLGDAVYGFGLDVDGLQVPFMVRMRPGD